MPDPNTPPAVPESRTVVKKKTRLSLVWIVPIAAALAGAWVAVVKIQSEGPTITIVFKSAEGLDAGKTKIHYNGVDVGTITKIRLSEDHQRVIATAEMAPKTEAFLVEDTNFWIETARISGATVSGLGTLLSGAYIGMEIGSSSKKKREFVALDTPPIVTSEVPGRFFMLKAPGSRLARPGHSHLFPAPAGRRSRVVRARQGRPVLQRQGVRERPLRPIRQPRYALLASERDRRFAHRERPQRADAIRALAADRRHRLRNARHAARPCGRPTRTRVFTFFRDRTRAFEPPPRHPQTFVLVFKQSVRGLAPGAPVEFHGIQIGEVVEINAQVDEKTAEFSVPVTVRVDAQKLGVKLLDAPSSPEAFEAARRKMIDSFISRGFRAQLQTGNLLTGALFVAFDAFPGAPPATVDWSQTPPRLPTIPGELQAIEASIVNIVKKLEKVPLEDIGDGSEEGARRSARHARISDAHARQRRQDRRAELGAQQRPERDPRRGESGSAGDSRARGLPGAAPRVAAAR